MRGPRMRKVAGMIAALAVVALVAGCGAPGGRCSVFSKGYPLCGL